MVLFRVVLELHNFQELQEKLAIKNKKKANSILKFYKSLAKMIVFFNNKDIQETKQHIEDYYEPFIKLCKNLFVFRDATSDNDIVRQLLSDIFPPCLELDFEFKMHKVLEQKAVKDFAKTNKIKYTTYNYKELRNLYYSTKITTFVSTLNNALHNNMMWQKFIEKKRVKTKYIPHISVSNTTVISLF